MHRGEKEARISYVEKLLELTVKELDNSNAKSLLSLVKSNLTMEAK